MDANRHFLVNLIPAIIFLAVVYKNLNAISSVVKDYALIFLIFSTLPDIDNKKSNISGFVKLTLVILFFAGIMQLINKHAVGIYMVITSALLYAYKTQVEEDSQFHRKFPHTLTFGLLASLVLFFATWYAPIAIFGILMFTLHIIADYWKKEDRLWWVIKRDVYFWKKIKEGKFSWKLFTDYLHDPPSSSKPSSPSDLT